MYSSNTLYLESRRILPKNEPLLSSSEYAWFWINIIEQQATANIDTRRCIGVQVEKLDALSVNSNSFKTYVAKEYTL